MRKIYFVLIICNFMFSFAFAQGKKEQIPFIYSESPKYNTTEFITLEEIHKINVDEFEEYYIYKVESMDADNDANLYVLDRFECTITVFDKNGKFIRTMSRRGQGPGELENPESISINNGKIYIYQDGKGIKILNLQGKYIDFFLIPIGNYYVIKAYDDCVLTVNKKYVETWLNINHILQAFSNDFSNIMTIAECSYKDDPEKLLLLHPILVAMNSKQNVYFPESFEEYKINVYSLEGDIIKSFGRKYKRIPYSKQVREWIYEDQKRSRPLSKPKELTKYPPVFRYILFDDRDYIWVVVGEWSADCGLSSSIVSTVDIFNEDGEFLYTFNSPNVGYYSFIKNGRLYSTPTQDDNYIRVFKIHYNYEN